MKLILYVNFVSATFLNCRLAISFFGGVLRLSKNKNTQFYLQKQTVLLIPF